MWNLIAWQTIPPAPKHAVLPGQCAPATPAAAAAPAPGSQPKPGGSSAAHGNDWGMLSLRPPPEHGKQCESTRCPWALPPPADLHVLAPMCSARRRQPLTTRPWLRRSSSNSAWYAPSASSAAPRCICTWQGASQPGSGRRHQEPQCLPASPSTASLPPRPGPGTHNEVPDELGGVVVAAHHLVQVGNGGGQRAARGSPHI